MPGGNKGKDTNGQGWTEEAANTHNSVSMRVQKRAALASERGW
jgi:hypothetical protein